MKATLLVRDRYLHPAGGMVEIVLWQLPDPVRPCTHSYKYRIVYVIDGVRVAGFDNERGKGDHYHLGGREHAYSFSGLEALMADFSALMEDYIHAHNTRNGQRDF